MLFLVFGYYVHTLNTDVLVHAWAAPSTEVILSFLRSERIMSKNDVFLFWAFSSAAACKSAKLESNRQLANDVCRVGHPPPSQQMKDLVKTSHTCWNICSTKWQNLCLGVVTLYTFMVHVCDMHVFIKGINPRDREQGHYKHLPSVTWMFGNSEKRFSEAFTHSSSHFQHTLTRLLKCA